MEESNKPLTVLSASRLKVFENCSWIYWCENHLKLPRSTNDGALRGSTVHNIFEILLNKKHINHFNEILKHKTIKASKPVCRLVNNYFRTLELNPSEENLRLVDEMIVAGLATDFFPKGRTIISPEYKFEIINESPKYSIRGFMDKISIKGKTIQIEDYKSSKEKFKDLELANNLQALSYSLACKKIWPELKPFVRFVFLRHDDPIQKISFDENTLRGFEFYLEFIQEKINNFTEKDAKSNFAYDRGMPTDGSFSGALMCGRNREPGQLKKNGEVMWGCLYKFPFHYYVVLENDKIIESVMDGRQDKIKLKENQILEKRKYNGCPRFNK